MLTASDVAKIKVVVVLVSTVLMLWLATEFWSSMFKVAGAEFNFRDVVFWALHSYYYQATVLVIVGIAGLLLWRWLRPAAKH